ncbi:MAG: phage tail protein [Dehalococcoidia bacterium]|nr:phage tail protein [Dehalococcoidia bacterium]
MIETRIDALDFLAQLGDEIVFDYEVEDATITTIVTALLTFQLNTVPITLGTIEPVVTRSISVQQDTILGVLQGLRDTVGGYISVDINRRLNWLDNIGEDKGQQIRYKKNIKGLSRTREYTNFGNRLYCYGAGEGTARIHLDDAVGMTVDYVEDIPSQNIYGKCIRQLTDKSITDPDVLLAWANLKLEEMKDPRHSYTVDMVNLAAMGWDFEALQLGSMVKVIDEDLGIDINARIVKITRDLSDPTNIRVEISNPGKDIIDTMGGVYDTQQFESHIATKIGAGQVVVLGTFVVSDWLTAGTTLIKGDYIRSGTLESNNWGVGAGSQFDLVAGTFKLGGSAAPKLSWDGATLTITGAIYATSGEFTGTLKVTNLQAGSGLTVYGTIIAGGGGVKISSTGINIFGLGNALTTRATEAGTIQCYVGADGRFYAGAGAVKLDSAGLTIYGQLLKFYSGTTYVGVAGAFSTTAMWMGAAAANINLTLLAGSGGFIYASQSILPTSTSHDLGSATSYWDDVNYTDLFDRASAKPIFDSYTDVIKGIKTKKRKITIKKAEDEGMGKRTIKRIEKHGGNIEEFDLATFPEDLLDVPTQEDYDEAEKRNKELSEYAGEGILLPIKKLTPKVGKSLNDLVYVMLRSQQEILERLERLEAK